jgi:hypothetical protein
MRDRARGTGRSTIRGMRHATLVLSLLWVSCGPSIEPPADTGTPFFRDAGTDAGPAPRVPTCIPGAPAPGPYPAPDGFPPAHGPGLGEVDTAAHPVGTSCAFLDGGELDVTDHHNLAVMFDGYLLLPWAPESGGGGLTFFDVSDPCAPTVVGSGYSRTMRETHAIGFSNYGGVFAVVDQMTRIGAFGGIQFWDVSDPAAPVAIADLETPHFFWPDSYARPTLSVFWQSPTVFVGATDTGIHVVDAADPYHPSFVTTYTFEPVLRVGQVQAIGNMLVVSAAEGARTVLLDVSDPDHPQPIPGGDFNAVDSAGEARDAYFGNASGGYVFYARKESGGGLLVMDIHDPTRPTYAADYASDGNGGYVFLHEDRAFVGESSVARVYDISDLFDADPERVIPAPTQELHLQGDLDFAVPVGQLVHLSVDDDAMPNQGSSLAPWTAEADRNPPIATWAWPAPGATVPVTSRFGVTFNEMIDVQSAWEGSVRLYRADAATPDEGRVDGIVSAQETIVNFVPLCPLAPDAEYVLEIPAGGLRDVSGNALAEPVMHRFHT